MSPLPHHLQSLADLCRRHPTARKVVFAPSEQAGRAARAALARAGVAYVALEVTTPAALAREWLPPEAERMRPLPYFAEGFIVDALLEAQRRRGRDALRAAAPRPGALAETIVALRMAGISAADLRAGARVPRRRAALADVLEGYDHALTQGHLLDDARALAMATARVAVVDTPAHTVFAVFDETRLTPLEERFVRALTGDGTRLERMGHGTPGLAPARRSALALFWPEAAGAEPPDTVGPGAWLGADEPPVAARAAMRAQLRVEGTSAVGILRSVGVTVEVRDALRDILERRLPLDDVEIAYAANTPYLMALQAEERLREMSAADAGDERERLPMTFAAGLPVLHTAPGQALRGALDWLENDFDTGALLRLLQGRLLRLDRDDADANHRAAHELLRGGLAAGAGAHDRALNRAEAALVDEARRTGRDPAPDLDRAAEARFHLGRLTACLPENDAPPALFARGLAELLDRFGPVDGHAVRRKGPDEVLSADERAHVIVRDRLLAFASAAPTTRPVSPDRAARALRDAALGGFVGAMRPRPGHLHVVPLDSAGFSGRPHLYVLGLDARTSAPASREDVLLPDRDRDEIDAAGELLERGADRAGAQAWHFARSLARMAPEATITLCAQSHDPATGETLFAGGLLLRAADLAGLDLGAIIEPPALPQGMVPDLVFHSIALHDVELDLAARHDEARLPGLRERFPVAEQGRFADEARASDGWTIYDGALGGRTSRLDPLTREGPVSTTRLETLAACPYRYFVEQVLNVRGAPKSMDEDEVLDAADRGTVLHSVFERFSRRLVERGERPAPAHEAEIIAITDEAIEEMLASRGEPAAPARAALRRAMVDIALLFLRDEIAHADEATPVAFEHRFGFDEPLRLALGGEVVELRGVVDRVERRPDGSYEVVDFKTGSAYGYADQEQFQNEQLANGARLQWALYALALGQSEGWNVTRAGYRFMSRSELAERRSYAVPAAATLGRTLTDVVAPARRGAFVPRPDANSTCKYCDVKRACGDLGRRAREARRKNRDA